MRVFMCVMLANPYTYSDILGYLARIKVFIWPLGAKHVIPHLHRRSSQILHVRVPGIHLDGHRQFPCKHQVFYLILAG
jgi:hypothetical protein